MQETPLFFIKNRIYFVGVLLVFLTSFYGCGRTSGQQSPEIGALNDDGKFSTSLPKPLHENQSGLTAEVQIIKDDSTVDRTEPLFIDSDTHQVSGRIDGLSTGTYTFTIRYYLRGVLVATETAVGLVSENTTTPIAFVSLTFPDNDNDELSNLDELEFGTNPNIPLANVSVVSAGNHHACAIKNDGSLWCWGSNTYGQLGDNTTVSRQIPTQENSAATDWAAVAAGSSHTCAIKTEGSLWCWGSNFYGGLGDSTTVKKQIPTQENSVATDWIHVTTGRSHTCAIKKNGSLWCWGRNSSGELGDNTTVDRLLPILENTAAVDWTAVTAGSSHTCAIKNDGSLWCWGNNQSGELGDNTTLNKRIPTQENSASTNWTAVSAGWRYTCAIKSKGSLWCWGDNSNGRLGNNTTINKLVPTQEDSASGDWTTATTGTMHTCAIKNDGSLWCWGTNQSGELGDNTTLNKRIPTQENSASTNWTAVSAGWSYTCAIKNKGSLWCWGSNYSGKIGANTTADKLVPMQENSAMTDWTTVTSGFIYTCAIKNTGSLWCWGSNSRLGLGDNTTVNKQIPTQENSAATDWTTVTAGGGSTCGTKNNGSLWCWGWNSSGELGDNTTVHKWVPTQENTAATDWTTVAAAEGHTCAIKSNGSLWCWGENSSGELGDNTTTRKLVPTQENSGTTDWTSVIVAKGHTCAIKSNGSLWCWGSNSDGKLGDNTTDNRLIPTRENSDASDWIAVSAGYKHTCAIKTDGSLWCWGLNSSGELGDNTRIGKLVPTRENSAAKNWSTVSVGRTHTCAIKSNGSIWCWGFNFSGELGDNTRTGKLVPTQESSGALDWITVSAGTNHTCAIKDGASLWCWGRNSWGQIGDGQAWKPSPRPVHFE